MKQVRLQIFVDKSKFYLHQLTKDGTHVSISDIQKELSLEELLKLEKSCKTLAKKFSKAVQEVSSVGTEFES